MTRPLFWAVSMFALGEVTYFVSDRVMQVSIIFVMLIFLVFIFKKKKNAVIYFLAFFFFYLMGYVHIMYEEQNNIINILNDISGKKNHYNVNCGLVEADEEEYCICISDKSDYSYKLYCRGIVWNVEKGEKGNNVTVKIFASDYDNKRINTKYKVLLYGIAQECKIGDIVLIEGEFFSFSTALNPGGFDLRKYYNARDVWLCSYECKLDCLQDKSGGLYYSVKDKLYTFRNILCRQFNWVTNDEKAELYKGMLLGEKDGIDDNIKALYQIVGIAHVLSISGLHVTMIGNGVYKLLRGRGVGFLVSGCLSIILVIMYGIMTGMGVPTLRAVIMLVVLTIGEMLGKNYDTLTSMALTLFLVLLFNPYMILDGGLWLSFGAIFGVALAKHIMWLLMGNTKLKRKLKKKRILYSLLSSVVMSICISAIMLPILIKLYFQFSLYSVFVNFIVIPLMTVVVACGVLAQAVSFFNLPLGRLIIMPGNMVLELYEFLCNMVTRLPFGNIVVGNITWLNIIFYYAVIILVLVMTEENVQRKIREIIYKKHKIWMDYRKWKKIKCLFIFAACTFFVVGNGLLLSIGKTSKIIFLDVGQGDGTIIVTENGYNIVVDGGSVNNRDMGKYTLVPALKYYGISRVDYWFVSHWDMDHISGLEYVLGDKYCGIEVENIVTGYDVSGGEDIIKRAKELMVNIMYVEAGEYITDGSFSLDVTHPYKESLASDKNENSLVLLYKENNVSLLFTGDVGVESLERIYNRNNSLFSNDIDILKVPHHGSRYSVHYKFLSCINPGVSIISAGKNNIYGHPHKETLEALYDLGSRCFVTKDYGAIIIKLK